MTFYVARYWMVRYWMLGSLKSIIQYPIQTQGRGCPFKKTYAMLHHFTSAADVDHWPAWLASARAVKANPRAQPQLGSGRAMCLLFLNPSLRTRLSTQRAALNLGLDTVVFDVQQGGWQLEMADGTVMSGDQAEHVREAAAVVGQYYDLIGVRAFASLKSRDEDYQEQVIQQFVRYAGLPGDQPGVVGAAPVAVVHRPDHHRGTQDKRTAEGGRQLGAPPAGPAAGGGELAAGVDAPNRL